MTDSAPERRPIDGFVHPHECEGHFCPCYQAGLLVAASSHYEVLLWFARRDPELVQQALREANADEGDHVTKEAR